jgi:hypothetical protein
MVTLYVVHVLVHTHVVIMQRHELAYLPHHARSS